MRTFLKHVFLRGSMKNIFHISLYVFLFNIIIDYYEFKISREWLVYIMLFYVFNVYERLL